MMMKERYKMANEDYLDLTKELNQVGICCACTTCVCNPCMCVEDDCCQPGSFIPNKEYGLLVEL